TTAAFLPGKKLHPSSRIPSASFRSVLHPNGLHHKYPSSGTATANNKNDHISSNTVVVYPTSLDTSNKQNIHHSFHYDQAFKASLNHHCITPTTNKHLS